MGHHEHKKHAPVKVTMAVLSISSSRSIQDDESGHWIMRSAIEQGHDVIVHRVIPDDVARIAEAVLESAREPKIQAVLVTGGTGITPDDVTIEAVKPLFTKELSAFSSLFALLGHRQVGSSTMLSRAAAGIVKGKAVFCMPGSLKACKLACESLIFPELGHIVGHLQNK